MDLDLELYRVFCEVVKHKNISKTAESMYISQSAITQSMTVNWYTISEVSLIMISIHILCQSLKHLIF